MVAAWCEPPPLLLLLVSGLSPAAASLQISVTSEVRDTLRDNRDNRTCGYTGASTQYFALV